MNNRFHNSTALYRLTHILSDFLYRAFDIRIFKPHRGFGKWLPKPQAVIVNVEKPEIVNTRRVNKYGR